MEIPELDDLLERETALLAEIDQLRTELVMVRVAIDQTRRSPARGEPTVSDRIVEVLRAGGVMSPSGIVAALEADGVEVHAPSIGGLLQALRRKGRIRSIGRGRWVAME